MLYCLFPCACCHTGCQQDPVGWSPWGSCTLGKGVGMGPACSINALSKHRGICTFPWDVSSWSCLWKCSAFPVSSSMELCPVQILQIRSGFNPGYQSDHHPDPSTLQSRFLSRETNFQLSDPLVSLEVLGSPEPSPALRILPGSACSILRSEHSKVGSLCGTSL